MEKSLAPGSQTFDQSLVALVRGQRVRKEDALANADSATNLLWLLENSAGAAPAAGAAAPALPALPGRKEEPAGDAGPSFSEFLLNI